jgi:hypothetical protein
MTDSKPKHIYAVLICPGCDNGGGGKLYLAAVRDGKRVLICDECEAAWDEYAPIVWATCLGRDYRFEDIAEDLGLPKLFTRPTEDVYSTASVHPSKRRIPRYNEQFLITYEATLDEPVGWHGENKVQWSQSLERESVWIYPIKTEGA